MVKDASIDIMFVMVGENALMVVMNGIGTAVCIVDLDQVRLSKVRREPRELGI